MLVGGSDSTGDILGLLDFVCAAVELSGVRCFDCVGKSSVDGGVLRTNTLRLFTAGG